MTQPDCFCLTIYVPDINIRNFFFENQRSIMSCSRIVKNVFNVAIHSSQMILDFLFMIYNVAFKRHRPVPRIHDDACLWSVTKIASKIRGRDVTAVAVMEAFVRRIKAVNPILNCVVDERFEDAMKDAAKVDEMLDKDPHNPEISRDKKPLLGVPFTSKEAFKLKGLSCASGLVSLRGTKASVDAPVVTRLKAAGGIPLAVTAVPELCMWWETRSRLYGRTKNVYDTRRIVGGSSGGEACLISSAGSVFGIGSDIGGSIRIPAFFNGVFGHKPSRYVVPNEGQVPGDPREDAMLFTGPICRFAADLGPTLKVMAGKEAERLGLDRPVDLTQLTVISVPDDGGGLFVSPLSPELSQMQRRVLDFLASKGAKVEERRIPEFVDTFDMWTSLIALTGATPIATLMGLPGDKPIHPLKELLKWFMGKSIHTFPAIGYTLNEAYYPLSEEKQRELKAKAEMLENNVNQLLGETGILLYPSNANYAYFHNQPLYKIGNVVYTLIFNVLGFPVTQVPLGLGRAGVPLGLQVVAGHDKDRLTLAVAEALEKEFGGWIRPDYPRL